MLKTCTEYYKCESMFHGFIPYVMGTRFDILILGSDCNLLGSLWTDIARELESLDKMLNRYDANSEVSYINMQTYKFPFQISLELWNILKICTCYYEKTLHLFDVTLKSFSEILFQENQRISFEVPDLSLDFGGFAKGYALMKIKAMLLQNNVKDAFVNFGNSSIMGMGHHPYGDCWKVSFLSPYDGTLLNNFNLNNESLSTSGNTQKYGSHIINPLTQIYNKERKAATIISENPIDAEVLSTVWIIANAQQRKLLAERFHNIHGQVYNL